MKEWLPFEEAREIVLRGAIPLGILDIGNELLLRRKLDKFIDKGVSTWNKLVV